MSEVIENNLVGITNLNIALVKFRALLRGLLKVSLNTFGYEVKSVEFQIPDLVISIWILRMKGQF